MRAATLVLLAVLLLPLAGADHVFSHRVYVVGRVVDSEGQPVPGLPVNVTFEGVRVTGRCFDSKDEVTGPRGDYTICRHAHAIPEGGRATVHAGGSERVVAVDPDLRHATASLQLAAPREARDFEGDIQFARTLHVAGRAFVLLPEPVNAEGVHVNASPIPGNVSVELRAEGAVVASRNVTADEHGAYAADLDVVDVPAGAVVRVRMGPDGSESTVDALLRRVDVNVVRDLRLLDGPGDEAPGSRTPAGAWIALTALLTASVAWRWRRRR